MNSNPSARPEATAAPARRRLFVGAGAVGAAALATQVLPGLPGVATTAPEDAPAAPPERGGGYRLSAHVSHYYKTTRL